MPPPRPSYACDVVYGLPGGCRTLTLPSEAAWTALNRGDASVLPKDGVLSIPARVIRKDTVDAFWKDLKDKLEAGKAGKARG